MNKNSNKNSQTGTVQNSSHVPCCARCGSKDIDVDLDAGRDIDPSGEEIQHLETCNKCGAYRFVTERWEGFTDYHKHFGQWMTEEGDIILHNVELKGGATRRSFERLVVLVCFSYFEASRSNDFFDDKLSFVAVI